MSTPIKVTILGRTYPLKVEADEIDRIREVSAYVDRILTQFKDHLRHQPESTAMALGALQIAEELFQARQRIQELETNHVERPATAAASESSTANISGSDTADANESATAHANTGNMPSLAPEAPTASSDEVVELLNRKLEGFLRSLQAQS